MNIIPLNSLSRFLLQHGLTLVAAGFCFVFSACSPKTKPADDNGVQDVFKEYRTAMLSADGKKAWPLLDGQTQKYYEQAVADVRDADRAAIEKLDLVTRLTVLRGRVEFSPAQIKELTGQRFFEYSIEQGWISRSSVEKMASVVVSRNDGSRAAVSMPDYPGVPAMYFVKEGGSWRIALSHSIETANTVVREQIKKSGMAENDWLLAMIRQISRREVPESVFDRPVASE